MAGERWLIPSNYGILRDVYQSRVSAPQYNNASAISARGGPPRRTGVPLVDPSTIIFAPVAPKQRRVPRSLFLKGEHSWERLNFRYRTRCDYQAYRSIGIYAARARSRSKSLSRRRSFSITAWHNYKGARNCSSGAHRSSRKSRNAHRRAATCASL